MNDFNSNITGRKVFLKNNENEIISK